MPQGEDCPAYRGQYSTHRMKHKPSRVAGQRAMAPVVAAGGHKLVLDWGEMRRVVGRSNG